MASWGRRSQPGHSTRGVDWGVTGTTPDSGAPNGHPSEVTTVIWFLVGAIGAGAIRARQHPSIPGRRRRADTARRRSQPPAPRYRRQSEIRLLQHWYASAEASTQTGARRFIGRLVLAAGATGGSRRGGLLLVVAVPRGPHPLTALLRGRRGRPRPRRGLADRAALALAANITGLLSLVISRSTPAGWLTVTDVVVALAALATLVGLSAIIRALRQPPRLLDLAPTAAGTGSGRARRAARPGRLSRIRRRPDAASRRRPRRYPARARAERRRSAGDPRRPAGTKGR